MTAWRSSRTATEWRADVSGGESREMNDIATDLIFLTFETSLARRHDVLLTDSICCRQLMISIGGSGAARRGRRSRDGRSAAHAEILSMFWQVKLWSLDHARRTVMITLTASVMRLHLLCGGKTESPNAPCLLLTGMDPPQTNLPGGPK